MANKNNFYTYIFGNWEKFLLLLITSIISLVGYAFMGGAFIQLKDAAKIPAQVKLTDPKDGMGSSDLYRIFLINVYTSLEHYIKLRLNQIVSLSEFVPPTLILLLLPFVASLGVSILFPAMVIYTFFIGFTMTITDDTKWYQLPIFNISHFCNGCKKSGQEDGGIFAFISQSFSWWGTLLYTILLFIMNLIAFNCIAGAGALYIVWYLLLRPLYCNPEGKVDVHNYKKIITILMDYTNTLLFMCSLIYFIAGVMYLGTPLQIATALVFIVSVFWLLFEYLKAYYLKTV
jgi:hypothetical protein